MPRIHHINCGFLHAPPYPRVLCHCLLVEGRDGLTLVDAGIGLLDVESPVDRIGRDAIDAAGFQFHEADTAVRQIEALGLSPRDVRHIVLTHCDPDHTGGLADFPQALVHVAAEEIAAVNSALPRYAPAHFEHQLRWQSTPPADDGDRWFGLEARPLSIDLGSNILLVPLFGHTPGHCGVAIQRDEGWLLHAGDAYYLRPELETDDHPVSAVAAARAESDRQRRQSIQSLRRLLREHSAEVELFCYHDPDEYPGPLAANSSTIANS